ncbi:MAG TPA: SGNH/GDSL hydrolase family protein [Dyadobacter sp.]|jgi:lysophospholipase L1-like esterase|nr:SGNH/GDSL hydrolase family protein [Dyadobacter sp.]
MRKLINLWSGLLLILTACSSGSDELPVKPGNPQGNNQEETTEIRFLALGDSYTIGQSVPEDQRWPVLMVKDLRRSGKSMANAEIIARTGWTTGDLLNTLNSNPPKQKYNLVSLLIGVNNQYQGRTIAEYKDEFNALLDKAVSYSSGGKSKVFVLSIPDWGMTSYASGADRGKIAKEIDQFNEVAKGECNKQGITFINITEISRRALNDNSMVASDGLHYSGKMHQLWVNESLSSVKMKL